MRVAIYGHPSYLKKKRTDDLEALGAAVDAGVGVAILPCVLGEVRGWRRIRLAHAERHAGATSAAPCANRQKSA